MVILIFVIFQVNLVDNDFPKGNCLWEVSFDFVSHSFHLMFIFSYFRGEAVLVYFSSAIQGFHKMRQLITKDSIGHNLLRQQ